MNGQTERHGHVSLTHVGADGVVTRTDVHVVAALPETSDDECFDPETCCDAMERSLIAAMRAYLRPDVAPECLMARLRETLDRCCCE
ncbi:hypothetical protein [Bifidobacterium samirii]|uniref:Uncharacterized protein n=1 Tax=Bifidobacterium samirii TaxID=2306974 RepID=A0A430FV38_9BIFI|nr:hypothetical protein [Bifidobacterium samirii]RSX57265.1 hypothetical protein D2E24_0858 [Bifidobacterium samirii]